jgi:transcriptional regulator with XRE-family HTH domain
METKVAKKASNTDFQARFNILRGELSQAEFAKKLGVSRPTIGFYENGERVPDILMLKKIAETYKVSADWLLGLSDIKIGDANDVAIEKRLGLSEDAIKTLERLNSSEANVKDDFYSVALPSDDWEEIRTRPDIAELYERSKHIIKILNLLLSTKRSANKNSKATHAEYILHTLYEYFYCEPSDNLDRTFKMACIHADIIEFGRTLKKGDEQ